MGQLKSKVVSFSTEDTADLSLSGSDILDDDKSVIDISTTRLRGLHNVENAMAAYAACKVFEVSATDFQEAMNEFIPPVHRCELVRTLDDVEYINDSKATNLHALVSALRSQSRPVVLIAGGKDKGLDYTEVLPRLRMNTKCVIVFGQIAQQLEQTFAPLAANVATHVAKTLEDAVHLAQEIATSGDVVLFSPGTSSFDMFSGYEQRGDCFRDIVSQLK